MPYPNFPRYRPGAFGVERAFLNSGQIGGTNYLGGTAPLTASATTIFQLGGFAGRRMQAIRLGASATTVPTGGAAITAKLVRYRASDTTAVDLTQNISLVALITRQTLWAELLTTLANGVNTIQSSDSVEVHVTAAGTVTVQPVGLVFTVEALAQA